jgi:hypothetical protein
MVNASLMCLPACSMTAVNYRSISAGTDKTALIEKTKGTQEPQNSWRIEGAMRQTKPAQTERCDRRGARIPAAAALDANGPCSWRRR